MKEFVSDEQRMQKIEDLREVLNTDSSKLITHFWNIRREMEFQLETLRNSPIDSVKLKDTDIYKSHLPVFLKINTEHIDRYESLKHLGVDKNKIQEFRDKKVSKEDVFNIFGITQEQVDSWKDKETATIEVTKIVAGRVTPEINAKIGGTLSFSQDEMNRILNGLDDYHKASEAQVKCEDGVLKDYASMKLYCDAFEVYLKVLKEAYSKIHEIPAETIENRALYTYFNEHYPLLLDSTNHKLRNDFVHGNYSERGKYTPAEIEQERKVILTKVYTALVAKNTFVINFFNESIEHFPGEPSDNQWPIKVSDEDFEEMCKIIEDVVTKLGEKQENDAKGF